MPEQSESLVRQIVSFLFPTRPVAIAAVAAAIVLCVQSVVIFSMLTSAPQTNQYQTATGGEENIVSGAGILVKIRMTVTIDQLQVFLEENKGQIIKGPNADGMYELRFGGHGNVSEPIADIAARTGIFEFVLPMQ